MAGDPFNLTRLHSNGTLSFDHWNDMFILQQNLNEYLNASIAFFPLIFSVEDNGVPKRFNWIETHLIVDLLNWSGTAPLFPLSIYRKFVMENSSLKKSLFEIKAINRLMNVLNQNWRYSLDLEMTDFKVSFILFKKKYIFRELL